MTTPTYDDANIFARILRGEIPAVKLYEDADVLAIMDAMPQAEGHVLVIPKAPSRNFLDADPAVLATLAARVQTIARAVKSALGAEGITIMQFNEPAGGQTVFHLHVHILPRFEGVELRRHRGEMARPETLIPIRDRIAAALKASA